MSVSAVAEKKWMDSVAEALAEKVLEKVNESIDEKWATMLNELVSTRKTHESLSRSISEVSAFQKHLDELMAMLEAKLKRAEALDQKKLALLDAALTDLGLSKEE